MYREVTEANQLDSPVNRYIRNDNEDNILQYARVTSNSRVIIQRISRSLYFGTSTRKDVPLRRRRTEKANTDVTSRRQYGDRILGILGISRRRTSTNLGVVPTHAPRDITSVLRRGTLSKTRRTTFVVRSELNLNKYWRELLSVIDIEVFHRSYISPRPRVFFISDRRIDRRLHSGHSFSHTIPKRYCSAR